MSISAIVEELDSEIARLQRAKEILSGLTTSLSPFASPRGGGDGASIKKRVFSPEARRRMAEAQRRRWAEQKKSTK